MGDGQEYPVVLAEDMKFSSKLILPISVPTLCHFFIFLLTIRIIRFFICIFCCTAQLLGSYFPDQGLNPDPGSESAKS